MDLKTILSLIFISLSTAVNAQPKDVEKIPVEISGMANLYFGEVMDTGKVRGGAGIPPVEIDLRGVKMISFEKAEGKVSCFGEYDSTFYGADGGAYGQKTAISDYGSFSGITHEKKVMFVAGVIVSDYSRLELPLPADDFTDTENWQEFRPSFDQPFFIGDGKTKAGATQTWRVPADATKLYLGFADCLSGPPSNYSNNGGVIKITVVLYRSDMGRN